MIIIINILIGLFISFITLFVYNRLKKPKIVYLFPGEIEQYKNDILNKIFEYQQYYASQADNIYRELEAIKHIQIDNESYIRLQKEFSKFEGMAINCQEIIKEIENIK